MEKYINYEMCSKCGGVCCKENGCIYMPSDFGSMSFKSLVKQIDKGNISISGEAINGFMDDYWSFIPYLRSRNIGSPVVDLVTKGGPCINLTDKGCKLNDDKRPCLGFLVKPTVIGGPCESLIRPQHIFEWLQYCNVLEKLVKYYSNKELEDVVVEQILSEMKRLDKKLEAIDKSELKAVELRNIKWFIEMINRRPYYPVDNIKKLMLK